VVLAEVLNVSNAATWLLVLFLMLLLLILLLTCFFFVGLLLEANGEILLRGMGENVILRVISSSSVFFKLWLMLSEAWKSE
jgi:hypothetical protein